MLMFTTRTVLHSPVAQGMLAHPEFSWMCGYTGRALTGLCSSNKRKIDRTVELVSMIAPHLLTDVRVSQPAIVGTCQDYNIMLIVTTKACPSQPSRPIACRHMLMFFVDVW